MAEVEDYSLSFEGNEVETLLQKIKKVVSGRVSFNNTNYRSGSSDGNLHFYLEVSDSRFSLFTNPVCIVTVDKGSDTRGSNSFSSPVVVGEVDTSAGKLILKAYVRNGTSSSWYLSGTQTGYFNFIVMEADI